MKLRSLIYGLLISSTLFVMRANAVCTKPSGTYVGSGMVNDLYSTSSNNEYTAVTASVTISSNTVTFRGFMKDLKSQSTKSGIIQAGTVTSWDPVNCIGIVTMTSSTTTNIVAVGSSDSGKTITFSDFTGSTGKLKIFDLILNKV